MLPWGVDLATVGVVGNGIGPVKHMKCRQPTRCVHCFETWGLYSYLGGWVSITVDLALDSSAMLMRSDTQYIPCCTRQRSNAKLDSTLAHLPGYAPHAHTNLDSQPLSLCLTTTNQSNRQATVSLAEAPPSKFQAGLHGRSRSIITHGGKETHPREAGAMADTVQLAARDPPCILDGHAA